MAKRFTISQGKTVHVKGLDEINAKLIKLNKNVGVDLLYEGLHKIADPIAVDMASRAPIDEGDLRASIAVSRKLTANQEKQRRAYRARQIKHQLGLPMHRRLKKEPSRLINFTAQLFVGVTQQGSGKKFFPNGKDDPNQYAHLVEWGTSDTPAQPFARPAWDAAKGAALATFMRFMKSKLGL